MKRLGLVLALALAALQLHGCNDDCPELEDEAEALTDEAAACSPGDSCVFANMYEIAGENNCLLAFQCHQPVNANTDLGAMRKRARRIVKDYDGCNTCAVASCVPPDMLVLRCDETLGRCVAEMKP